MRPMRFKPVKSSLEKAEGVHRMVVAGMPPPLARHVVRLPSMPRIKQKKIK